MEPGGGDPGDVHDVVLSVVTAAEFSASTAAAAARFTFRVPLSRFVYQYYSKITLSSAALFISSKITLSSAMSAVS